MSADRRRDLERRARVADDLETLSARAIELSRQCEQLALDAGPVDRALAAIVGSRAWGRLARSRVRAPARTDPDEARRLENVGAEVYALSRRARAYRRDWPALAGLGARRPARRPHANASPEPLAGGRVTWIDPRWGRPGAARTLAAAVLVADSPYVLIGARPPDVANMVAALDAGEDLVGVGCAAGSPDGQMDGAWRFDWTGGRTVPVRTHLDPAAIGSSCALWRARALRSIELPDHDDARGWGIDASLQLRQGGWQLAMHPGGVAATMGGDDWHAGLLDSWGGALTGAVLRDLAEGGARWCTRGLRVALASSVSPWVAEAVEANGWSVAQASENADIELATAADGSLGAVLRWPGTAEPARLDIDPGGASAEALKGAIVHAFERPTVAIVIAARDHAAAAQGGDHHFAHAVVRELGRRGHHAVVRASRGDAQLSAAAPAVRIDLLGRTHGRPRRGQLNVAWLISHPAQNTADRLRSYDLVLVASTGHTHRLIEAGIPAETLQQFCAPSMLDVSLNDDPERELAFVGNWRRVYRHGVWLAHEAGLRPDLVGTGWRHIAPDDLLAEHIPYEQLAAFYAGTRLLLVDHWDDMREMGFVSNRVFDALATGTTVACDRVESIDELLPGLLSTYESADDLRAIADHAREADRAARAQRQRAAIAAAHTCQHRVDRLLALFAETPAQRSIL